MKRIGCFLTIILLFTLFFNSHCLKTRIKNGIGKDGDINFEGFFWVQIFDATKDPEQYMLYTDRFSQWEYLRVDSESLQFTPNSQDLKHVSSKFITLKSN